jgi:hypothetical protein
MRIHDVSGLQSSGRFGAIFPPPILLGYNAGMSADDSEDRSFSADTAPLPGVASGTFKSHSLVPAGERRLVLRPSVGMRVLCLVPVALGAGMLSLTWIVCPPPRLEGWVLGGFGLVFLAAGLIATAALALGTGRVEFDRDAASVCFRGLLRTRTTRPLSDIIAVQLIHGGWHKTSGGSDRPQTQYFT